MSSFAYGTRSRSRLGTCHLALQEIADRALEYSPYDITIVHGWRDEEEQNSLFDAGASKKRWPYSRHNKTNRPTYVGERANIVSDALDFAPYIDRTIYWNDTHIFAVVAGCFASAAITLGYRLRWGGDWDSDGKTTDQTFMDWGHIEMNWSEL
jgi:peptidoglycan L-alanyl-D-glutamate endopeptidase CwlK